MQVEEVMDISDALVAAELEMLPDPSSILAGRCGCVCVGERERERERERRAGDAAWSLFNFSRCVCVRER